MVSQSSLPPIKNKPSLKEAVEPAQKLRRLKINRVGDQQQILLSSEFMSIRRHQSSDLTPVRLQASIERH
jgi:hypothetical protein